MIFLIAITHHILGQQLRITSKDSIEHVFLKNEKFIKTHTTAISLLKEVDRVSENLKKNGFFLNSIDSIIKKDSIYIAWFSLGNRIEKAIITITSKNIPIKNDAVKNKKITIPIGELETFLAAVTAKLDEQGQSFSEIALKNIVLKKNLLFADLNLVTSKVRTINKIIVKGYKNFSKSHLKRFLSLKKNTIFNQKKLKDISNTITSLNFVSEIKPPAILFSKDTTTLYLYLRKNKVNSFDGLLNFSSKENREGLFFNGYLDLKLNNILHTGEQFKILWKANGEERQEFRLSTQIPYIFNTAFTPDISFQIYKQDSTFLSTKFHSAVSYMISSKIKVGLTYTGETSKNTLQNLITTTVKDFSNSFWGTKLTYKRINNAVFFLNILPSFGYRSAKETTTSQFKVDVAISYLRQFSDKSSIFIKNKTGCLYSDNFIENELYRIGGINSIRGFNEQSIFASQYAYFNIEYRYHTSKNAYLYSITDIGQIKKLNSLKERLYGIGMGYLFKVKNSQIDLGYALGKFSNQNFDIENSNLLIRFLSFF